LYPGSASNQHAPCRQVATSECRAALEPIYFDYRRRLVAERRIFLFLLIRHLNPSSVQIRNHAAVSRRRSRRNADTGADVLRCSLALVCRECTLWRYPRSAIASYAVLPSRGSSPARTRNLWASPSSPKPSRPAFSPAACGRSSRSLRSKKAVRSGPPRCCGPAGSGLPDAPKTVRYRRGWSPAKATGV
jgi:hypothetical protein